MTPSLSIRFAGATPLAALATAAKATTPAALEASYRALA
jgi:hypothetical protein